MKPTPEQLKDPKWWDENAPRWATKALYYSPRERTIFSDGNFYKSIGGEIFNHHDDFTLSLEKCEPLATRPTHYMPEVGDHLECTWGNKATWHECVILLKNRVALLGYLNEVRHMSEMQDIDFRPIQSERDKWIAAAEACIEGKTGEPANSHHLALLVDAGLAKLSEGEE